MTLTNDNFIQFAKDNYTNTTKISHDFNEDLSRIMYIKKLFNRVTAGETVDYRLITNHLMILFNVFDKEAVVAMLFFKIEHELWGVLKTFLKLFGFSSDTIPILNVSIKDISTVESLEQELEIVYGR